MSAYKARTTVSFKEMKNGFSKTNFCHKNPPAQTVEPTKPIWMAYTRCIFIANHFALSIETDEKAKLTEKHMCS